MKFRFFCTFLLILSIAQSHAAQIGEDTLVIGKKGSSANKTVKMGNGRVVWNNSTSKLTFSNDSGSSFKNFGSGGGGGGGINLLVDVNFDFEGGTSSWTASGGSFTASNQAFGALAGVFNSSATSQTLSSSLVAIPEGFKSANGAAGCFFKTTATDYKLQVFDGTNVLAERLIPPSSVPIKIGTTFKFPSSGNVRLRAISQSDATDLTLDECFLGENTLLQISQAVRTGRLEYPVAANCNWQVAAGSFTSFTADSDCTVATAFGDASAPAAKIPGVTFANLAPGKYRLEVSAPLQADNGTDSCDFRLTDGTNNYKHGQAINLGQNVMIFYPEFTSPQTNITFQLQALNATNGANNCDVNLSGSLGSAATLSFALFKYPTENELAVRPETINWVVDAYQQGATFSVAHTSAGSFGPEDITTSNSLVLALQPGSLTALQACDGADSTGLSCAGNVRAGIAFTPPATGKIKVCADFSYIISSGGGNADTGFTLNEAQNAANTIITVGKTFSNNAIAGAGASISVNPNSFCEFFDVTSISKKTFVLNATGTVTTGISSQSIQSNSSPYTIHWKITPVTQNVPAPVLVGSVMQPGTGVLNTCTAAIAAGGAVNTSTGSCLSFGSSPATGRYILNFASGTFSAAPVCTCTAADTSFTAGCQFWSISSSQVEMATSASHLATSAIPSYLTCIGPK